MCVAFTRRFEHQMYSLFFSAVVACNAATSSEWAASWPLMLAVRVTTQSTRLLPFPTPPKQQGVQCEPSSHPMFWSCNSFLMEGTAQALVGDLKRTRLFSCDVSEMCFTSWFLLRYLNDKMVLKHVILKHNPKVTGLWLGWQQNVQGITSAFQEGNTRLFPL